MENQIIPEASATLLKELLKQITANKNTEINTEPELYNWDWNNANVIDENIETFFSIVVFNALYPDQETTKKIESSEILNSSKKWSISLESINIELTLFKSRYPELIIDAFLWVFISYLKKQICHSILKALDVVNKTVEYDNHIDEIKNLFRKRRRSPSIIKKNFKKQIEIHDTFSECIIQNKHEQSVDKIKAIIKNQEDFKENFYLGTIHFYTTLFEQMFGKLKARKYLIGMMTGDAKINMRMLPIDELEKYGKNELYRNLFHLFKFIIKDGEFLSEVEYEATHNMPYENYDMYRSHIVKIILGKT